MQFTHENIAPRIHGRQNKTFNVSCKTNLIPDLLFEIKTIIFFSYFCIFLIFFSFFFTYPISFVDFYQWEKDWIKWWFTTIMIKDKDFFLLKISWCLEPFFSQLKPVKVYFNVKKSTKNTDSQQQKSNIHQHLLSDLCWNHLSLPKSLFTFRWISHNYLC